MNNLKITISKNKKILDLELIYNFLKQTYWAHGRTKQQVEKSIENSICYGVFENNQQVGFARVISDQVTYAYIADVFIIKTKRGLGYSKKLMASILEDDVLSEVKSWYLITKDAQGLYEKFGFQNYRNLKKKVMFFSKNHSL